MRIHLQTGPGHHEQILINCIRKYGIEFSYSSYHPKYLFEKESKNGQVHRGSGFYDFIKWMVWGLTNKFKMLRRRNQHLFLTYSLYDFITSTRINKKCKFLFGWAQVSLFSIRNVKKSNGVAILDYPIPHILKWQQLLSEEGKLISNTNIHSFFSKAMVKRMIKEINEADFISVPSEFVKKSFIEFGVPESKLIFNSYGIDTAFFRPQGSSENTGTFVILFVGSIEIRKGVHYLLEMFERLKIVDTELRIVGTLQKDMRSCFSKYSKNKKIKWLGQLSKEETLKELQCANIMVMPSILEGLSLTILEAMACGTPVISTTNAGGLGVIENGIDGFVIPIRDVDLMKRRIEWCIRNPEELQKMGERAREKVLSGYRQEDYGDRFMNLVLSKYDETRVG